MHSNLLDIAQTAARLIVEEGVDYGSAKRHALKLLGLPPRTTLPDNDLIEAQVREHISIFCAETQPAELLQLRQIALKWMHRLHEFRPHLTGAVWSGTATRNSDIYIQLFCDDPKSAEIRLINEGVKFDTSNVTGMRRKQVDALTVTDFSSHLDQLVALHFLVYDRDDIRGALKPNAEGKPLRGDTAAVQALLEEAV